jgi:hypothetical protein
MTVTPRFILMMSGIVGLVLALDAMHATPRSARSFALSQAQEPHRGDSPQAGRQP